VVGAGLVLIVGVIVTVRRLARLPLSTQGSALRTEAAPAALPLPGKPSVVVLPFKNMSNDPEQEYFSDGLTEDLTSDLSQLSSLFVISRNTAFTYRETKKEANVQARQMFERALELDPQYAGAYVGLGVTYFFDWFYQWNNDPTQSLERAFELEQRAVALDDSLPLSHQVLGLVYLWKKQHEQAIAEAQRAITPAGCYAELGRLEEARAEAAEVLRLNPNFSLEVLRQKIPYKDPAFLERYLAAQRKAGMK
jgi:hypothetical protein